MVLELASAEMYPIQLTRCHGVSDRPTHPSRRLTREPRKNQLACPPLREPGWTESLPLIVFLVSLLLFGMARVGGGVPACAEGSEIGGM